MLCHKANNGEDNLLAHNISWLVWQGVAVRGVTGPGQPQYLVEPQYLEGNLKGGGSRNVAVSSGLQMTSGIYPLFGAIEKLRESKEFAGRPGFREHIDDAIGQVKRRTYHPVKKLPGNIDATIGNTVVEG